MKHTLRGLGFIAFACAVLALANAPRADADNGFSGGSPAVTSITMGGDVTGASGSCTVAKVNGATVPAGGALVTGNVLQASGASSDTYGPVNLAGGAGYVTGTLPAGNQAAQTCSGDVTGNTGATVVSSIHGATVPAAGSLTTGNVLQASGSSSTTYAAVNLAGGAGYVTGSLPSGNQAAQTCTGDVTGNTGATVVSAISGSTPIAITPNELAFVSTATPLHDQTAAASTSAGSGAAGATTTIAAQAGQAATGSAHNGGAGGTLALQCAAGGTSGSATAGAQGFVDVTDGSGALWQLGLLVGQAGNAYGAVYAGGVTPTSSNYAIYLKSDGTALAFNGGSTLTFLVGTTTEATMNSTAFVLSEPLGGGSGTTFQWYTTASAIACATGGTQTISAAQATTPGLIVTTGTLTSTCILDFGTNGSTGYWVIDLSGATPGATYGIEFKNGSATKTFLSSSVLAGTLATVWTHGTNTLAVTY